MKICPTCGERLSDEARFCPVDGTALAQAMSDHGDDAATEQQFARTLYGAPAPGAMPEASSSDASYDDLPASTSVDVVSSAKGAGADAGVAPSRGPAAPAVPPTKANNKTSRTKRGIKSPADLFPRPKTNIGLAVAAALGGAAIVGVLALGVKLVRGTGGKPAVATVEPTAPTPTVVPTPTTPTGEPSAGGTATAGAAPGAAADAAGAPAPGEAESAASPASPDAGSPKEPESPAEQAVAGTPADDDHDKTPVAAPPQPPPAKADPKQAEIYVRAGEEHLKRGSHAKAQAAFEQARAYDPANAVALAGLGEVAFEQGEYARAIEHLRAAVRIDRNSRYLTLLGNSYFKSRNYRQAIEQYKRAQKLDPENAEASEGLKAAQTKLRGG